MLKTKHHAKPTMHASSTPEPRKITEKPAAVPKPQPETPPKIEPAQPIKSYTDNTVTAPGKMMDPPPSVAEPKKQASGLSRFMGWLAA